MKHEILGNLFNFVSTIEPDRDEEGNVHQFLPQARYRNPRGLRLHQHGAGPFCRFRIRPDLPLAGVYIIAVDDEIVYLGECQNLSARFNARGYGTISPRNCFQGGQSTNCRVNNLILKNAKQGRKTQLWFHQTSDRKFIEPELIRQLQPRWNSQLK